MPRLSLYRPNRTRDYQFLDRTISEMYTVGGLDIFVHKYLGPQTGGADSALSGNGDATQPIYDELNPLNIQDLLLLENRDRIYDQDVYTMRGVYNQQDIDFDLTQFGLFLNNDTLFITFHYNDMIDTFGRKLMNGDVLEVPNLKDYYPLNSAIPQPLPKYYVIQDAAFASEGFSQTWLPHLWRVKATPLTDAQEYKDVLKKPMVDSTIWDNGNFYPLGSVVNYGDVYYRAKINTPADTEITNTTYWEIYEPATQSDLMGTRIKDTEINDAILAQADVDVPLSGYNTELFYVEPTIQPTPAVDTIQNLWDQDSVYNAGTIVNLGTNYYIAVQNTPAGVALNNGQYWSPYTGTSGGPANPTGLTTSSSTTVDGTQGGMSISPDGAGYTQGYLTGDAAPNGLPVATGVAFPLNPVNGDYCLRLDYFPNRLFRYNSTSRRWIKIETGARTDLNNGSTNNTLRSSFVNNTYTVQTKDMGNIPSRQSLSEILKPRADNGDQGGDLPPNPYPSTQPGQKSS